MGKAAKAKAKGKATSSKAKQRAKKVSEKPVNIPETTTESFDFMALARKLATEVKDGATQLVDNLKWASGCDGLNTIAGVLEALGVPNHQAFGAEKAAAPAVFSLKRFAPGHLYQDW